MGLFEAMSPGGGRGRDLNFDVRTEALGGDRVRVVVAGDIDLGTSGMLRDGLVDAVTGEGLTRIEVDLSRVRLLDASGVSALMAARKEAESRGVRFEASGATGLPRRVLEILGLLHSFGAKT